MEVQELRVGEDVGCVELCDESQQRDVVVAPQAPYQDVHPEGAEGREYCRGDRGHRGAPRGDEVAEALGEHVRAVLEIAAARAPDPGVGDPFRGVEDPPVVPPVVRVGQVVGVRVAVDDRETQDVGAVREPFQEDEEDQHVPYSMSRLNDAVQQPRRGRGQHDQLSLARAWQPRIVTPHHPSSRANPARSSGAPFSAVTRPGDRTAEVSTRSAVTLRWSRRAARPVTTPRTNKQPTRQAS